MHVEDLQLQPSRVGDGASPAAARRECRRQRQGWVRHCRRELDWCWSLRQAVKALLFIYY